MDFKVDSLSWKPISKGVSVRVLKREAIKTGINPSLVNPGISVSFGSKRSILGREFKLDIDYGDNPVEVIDAYGHAMLYKVLIKDLGKKFYDRDVNVRMHSLEGMFSNANWRLRTAINMDPKEGARLFVSVNGHYDKNSCQGINAVWKCENKDLKYKGERILTNPLSHLEFPLNELNEDDIKEKIGLVACSLKPYFGFKEFECGESPEGSVFISGKTYLVKETPKAPEVFSVVIPVGEFGDLSKERIVAEYKRDC